MNLGEKIKSGVKITLPHVGLIILVLFVLASNLFTKISISLANENEEYSNIDPVQKAQFMRSTEEYTAFNPVDADEFEITSLVDESDGYINKDLGDNSAVTQIAKKDFEYVVQGGESLTSIANKFDLHVASIVERNSMDVATIENLKPGQKLIIPAEDFSNSKDWLVKLNDIKEQERQLALQKEQERQKQLAKQKKLAQSSRNTVTRSSSSGRSIDSGGSKYNGYPYGWCTYYVASRKNVPSGLGNAGQWLGNASRAGYATGDTPAPGAIMVSRESWWGHVAYVESVSGNTFTVSEMNYAGWGVVSSRTMNVNDSVIKGFIY